MRAHWHHTLQMYRAALRSAIVGEGKVFVAAPGNQEISLASQANHMWIQSNRSVVQQEKWFIIHQSFTLINTQSFSIRMGLLKCKHSLFRDAIRFEVRDIHIRCNICPFLEKCAEATGASVLMQCYRCPRAKAFAWSLWHLPQCEQVVVRIFQTDLLYQLKRSQLTPSSW